MCGTLEDSRIVTDHLAGSQLSSSDSSIVKSEEFKWQKCFHVESTPRLHSGCFLFIYLFFLSNSSEKYFISRTNWWMGERLGPDARLYADAPSPWQMAAGRATTKARQTEPELPPPLHAAELHTGLPHTPFISLMAWWNCIEEAQWGRRYSLRRTPNDRAVFPASSLKYSARVRQGPNTVRFVVRKVPGSRWRRRSFIHWMFFSGGWKAALLLFSVVLSCPSVSSLSKIIKRKWHYFKLKCWRGVSLNEISSSSSVGLSEDRSFIFTLNVTCVWCNYDE